jgi:hypothetical protein
MAHNAMRKILEYGCVRNDLTKSVAWKQGHFAASSYRGAGSGGRIVGKLVPLR